MLTGCRVRKPLKTSGVADYWGGDGVCLVEWADRVRGLLPDDCWMITLEPTGPTARVVRIELPDSRGPGHRPTGRTARMSCDRRRTALTAVML